jgi:hypothetical protein
VRRCYLRILGEAHCQMVCLTLDFGAFASGASRGSRSGETLKNPLKTQENEWCRRRESNDTRLLILRNLLQTYERKNRTTRCRPASYVQNHVQQIGLLSQGF